MYNCTYILTNCSEFLLCNSLSFFLFKFYFGFVEYAGLLKILQKFIGGEVGR